MDVTSILFGIIGFVVAGFIGMMVGNWSNPNWRCKFLRNFTKKPYVVAKLKRKDSVLISTHVVNAEKDVIVIGSDVWVIESGTVYLTRETKKGKKIERELIKETGKPIVSADIKEDLGAPTVFLNMDGITTISLDNPSTNTEQVKPSEVGPTLIAWIYNQYAKGLASQKNAQILLILTIFFCLLSAGIGYFNMTKIDQQAKKLTEFQEAIINQLKNNNQVSQTIKDGTVVITQSPAPNNYVMNTTSSVV